MIPAGPMALEKPQPADLMEPYFTGTMPSGGYWTTLERLSAHDHSGGLMGNPVAVVIPDGSITSADLAESVLAPYAALDGSKPFTGQVTMGADAVLRDTLYFGEQGTALAPDAHLRREGPGWLAAPARLDLAAPSGPVHLTWGGGAGQLQLYSFDARVQCATGELQLQALGGSQVVNVLGNAVVHDAVRFGAAGGTDGGDVTLRRTGPGALGLTSTLTWSDGAGQLLQNGLNARINAPAGDLELNPTSQAVTGPLDGFVNLGKSAVKWATVYATNGTIQTSDPDQKTAVVPVDPEEALADVLAADVIAYELPAPVEDDPGATMLHVGFDASTAPERLRVGRRAGPSRGARTSRAPVETSLEVEPNTTGSMALAAIQAVVGRLEELTQRVTALEAG